MSAASAAMWAEFRHSITAAEYNISSFIKI